MGFPRKGGKLEINQLWGNLPAKDKMTAPAYQEIIAGNIPRITFENDAGHMRLIAGSYGDVNGAAKTFTPVNLWDIKIAAGKTRDLDGPAGHNTMLLTVSGTVRVNDDETLATKELGYLTQEGDTITLHAEEDSLVLLMSGTPIDEPIVGRGPFVMNTMKEISDAMTDYALGKF